MSNHKKLKLLKEKAIPFRTLIHQKGHILLYAGTYKGKVVVFHNFWGVGTVRPDGSAGREVVGHAVFSTLEIGKELPNYDPSSKLLSKIDSFNVLTASK